MDINLVIYYLLCVVIAPSISQTDVCVTYKTLNSTLLKTDYILLSTVTTIQPDWYRYTGTTSGVIATSCSNQTNACGAKIQIWIEGSLPTFGSGIQQIASCVRTDRNGKCCGLRNTLDIANCNGFFVYHLTPSAPDSHYCFNATAPDLSTVTMPQTTTLDTSQDNTTTVLSTITFQQTTSINITPPGTSTLKLSTTTAPITTTMNSSLNATAALTTTLFSEMLTTQFQTSQSHTKHVTLTQVTYGTGSKTELMQSTPINKGLSSKTNQQSTEPEPLIGVVTGSVVGCVVVIIAVIAAVYYLKKFRGH